MYSVINAVKATWDGRGCWWHWSHLLCCLRAHRDGSRCADIHKNKVTLLNWQPTSRQEHRHGCGRGRTGHSYLDLSRSWSMTAFSLQYCSTNLLLTSVASPGLEGNAEHITVAQWQVTVT